MARDGAEIWNSKQGSHHKELASPDGTEKSMKKLKKMSYFIQFVFPEDHSMTVSEVLGIANSSK